MKRKPSLDYSSIKGRNSGQNKVERIDLLSAPKHIRANRLNIKDLSSILGDQSKKEELLQERRRARDEKKKSSNKSSKKRKTVTTNQLPGVNRKIINKQNRLNVHQGHNQNQECPGIRNNPTLSSTHKSVFAPNSLTSKIRKETDSIDDNRHMGKSTPKGISLHKTLRSTTTSRSMREEEVKKEESKSISHPVQSSSLISHRKKTHSNNIHKETPQSDLNTSNRTKNKNETSPKIPSHDPRHGQAKVSTSQNKIGGMGWDQEEKRRREQQQRHRNKDIKGGVIKTMSDKNRHNKPKNGMRSDMNEHKMREKSNTNQLHNNPPPSSNPEKQQKTAERTIRTSSPLNFPISSKLTIQQQQEQKRRPTRSKERDEQSNEENRSAKRQENAHHPTPFRKPQTSIPSKNVKKEGKKQQDIQRRGGNQVSSREELQRRRNENTNHLTNRHQIKERKLTKNSRSGTRPSSSPSLQNHKISRMSGHHKSHVTAKRPQSSSSSSSSTHHQNKDNKQLSSSISQSQKQENTKRRIISPQTHPSNQLSSVRRRGGGNKHNSRTHSQTTSSSTNSSLNTSSSNTSKLLPNKRQDDRTIQRRNEGFLHSSSTPQLNKSVRCVDTSRSSTMRPPSTSPIPPKDHPEINHHPSRSPHHPSKSSIKPESQYNVKGANRRCVVFQCGDGIVLNTKGERVSAFMLSSYRRNSSSSSSTSLLPHHRRGGESRSRPTTPGEKARKNADIDVPIKSSTTSSSSNCHFSSSTAKLMARFHSLKASSSNQSEPPIGVDGGDSVSIGSLSSQESLGNSPSFDLIQDSHLPSTLIPSDSVISPGTEGPTLQISSNSDQRLTIHDLLALDVSQTASELI